MRAQDRIFHWGSPGRNPYLGLLAHGDSFTVTADSLSMLIEVARLGKPVIIAEPPVRRGIAGLIDRIRVAAARDLGKAVDMLVASWAMRRGWASPPARPQGPCPTTPDRVAEKLRRLRPARLSDATLFAIPPVTEFLCPPWDVEGLPP